jgi:diguanylate cyclase (GGDEF)-like protein
MHGLALAAATAVVGLTAGSARWNLESLVVIACLTVVSDLTSVETGSSGLKISGSFLGLMLAAVLLGGAPAALVGVLTIGVGWFRWREDGHSLRNNLVTYAWFPLIGGLFFHFVVGVAHIDPHGADYYLLVFAAFALALAVNFVMVAGYQCYIDGASLTQKARDALAPILASELFSAALTMIAVYVAVQLGVTGLALFALVLVIFQYLVGALLVSKRRSEELQRMATTDELTGLANRERFRARLEQEIEAREQPGGAVMLIDLDHFKEINDTLGHHYGDVLLQNLGPRLAACVGPAGLVARLGGDEFAVLPGVRTDQPKLLEEFASDLLGCIQQPFLVDELSLEVGASVGIARFPLDGGDAHTLLRRADIAMYSAKATQSGVALYTPEQDKHSMQRLTVLTNFRRAIESNEIVVHYQPIVDLDDRSVHGAEGLVRWRHPERGLIAPAEFIQTVEQTELIGPLTRHVLDRAIAQCARWREAGPELSVAVNLSVRNLLDRSLPREIEQLLWTHSLPPEALKLEITESMIMSDPERALATITQISALGVRFSVDDFGTGHSSLAYLRRLPIDELKIDRSFVSPMLSDMSDLIIVRSTINLAHDLGLTIIAEGVEDEPTLERLSELGCDRAQGYHLSRPMPADLFAEWLLPKRSVRPAA